MGRLYTFLLIGVVLAVDRLPFVRSFQPPIGSVKRTYSVALSKQLASRKKDNTEPVVLPIFPLRKKIRLPTESLTLNLYEERYLRMSEYILKQNVPIFGTIYSSNKPQIVRNITGPIVPVFSEGDVGVLCILENSEEALIPTRGGDERRRIRLVARGAVRFEVVEIVDDGIGSDDSFILAQVELLFDDVPGVSSHRELQRSNVLDQFARLENSDFDKSRGSGDELVTSVENCIEWATRVTECLEIERDLEVEIISFALAAAYLPEIASEERAACLNVNNLEARLNITKPWLGGTNAFTRLFQL